MFIVICCTVLLKCIEMRRGHFSQNEVGSYDFLHNNMLIGYNSFLIQYLCIPRV